MNQRLFELKERLNTLYSRLDRIDGEFRTPFGADCLDQAVETESRRVCNSLRRTLLTEINMIQQASKHVADGNSGICRLCGETITDDRLAAVPYATACAECSRDR